MKKHLLIFALCLVSLTQAFGFTTVTVQDSISTNTHWTNDKQYLLKGWVYVTSGATLTIDSGVIIRGDKNTKGTLIVERGAKLYANGTASAPIVFTSNQSAGNRTYGDWGGVILCGMSPNNWSSGDAQVEGGPRSHYGGNDAHDNSGRMSYVRIEFGGIALSPNNEVNGLTLCSVGDATQIDHIQVSYSGDDAFEWFGGNVNAKYLIAFRSWDDDFDNDCGFQGKVQFGAVIRDPYSGDQSGSKGFESDSYQSGTDTIHLTKPIFSNITLIGPLVNANTTQYDDQIRAGVHIRRGSAMSLLNSIVAGWPSGLLLDEAAPQYTTTSGNIGTGELQFRNNIIAGSGTQAGFARDAMYVKDGARNLTSIAANADTTGGTPVPQFAPYAGPWTFVLEPTFHNNVYPSVSNGVRLTNPFNLNNPNLVPLTTSPVCYNAAHVFHPENPINYDTTNNYANYNVPQVAPDFTNSKASDAFFTPVNFVGAFAGTQTTNDNWTAGWAEWNPVDKDYEHVNEDHTFVKNVTNSIGIASVYPNPATNSAYVTFEMNQASDVSVTILDMTGKVVANVWNAKNVKGMQAINIDLAGMNSGFYFVSINSTAGNRTLKFSVIK